MTFHVLITIMEPFILTANSSSLRTDDFDARGEDELTLRRGDKIELIELDDGFGDGWYLGRHLTSGLTGLFPGGKSASPLAPPGLAGVNDDPPLFASSLRVT
jgi:hypothetical protein